MKILIKLFFILFTFTVSVFSQKIQYVNAESGLVVRANPDKSAQRIGKLQYGDQINIISKSGITFKVSDNGKIISGQWVEIHEPKKDLKGFVFSGYLTLEIIEKKEYHLTKIDPKVIKKFWEDSSNSIQTKPALMGVRQISL